MLWLTYVIFTPGYVGNIFPSLSMAQYLHVCRVIHRDLKTDNIFLDDRKNVKIGDLGIARWVCACESSVS